MDEQEFKEEFERNRLRYEALKEQVANEIEVYAHLVETEGPNIESQYMMHIGRFEIERLLDMEFSEWREKLDAFVAKVKTAKLCWDMAKLSSEETNAIRCEYLKAVKKLHPDLNPNLPEAAVSLWNQIQQAHSAKDWRKLKFLVSLVE